MWMIPFLFATEKKKSTKRCSMVDLFRLRGKRTGWDEWYDEPIYWTNTVDVWILFHPPPPKKKWINWKKKCLKTEAYVGFVLVLEGIDCLLHKVISFFNGVALHIWNTFIDRTMSCGIVTWKSGYSAIELIINTYRRSGVVRSRFECGVRYSTSSI